MVANIEETVLIVDDSIVTRTMLANLLEKHGYHVVTAESGKEALELLSEKKIDLVLLDIVVPAMDGYDLCEKIKTNKKQELLPVIFISSLDKTEDIIKGFTVGGVDYIIKPVRQAEVLARVSTHLHICRLQNKLKLERHKTMCLLQNVLPEQVAQELLDSGTCTPKFFPETTVCFVDIVEFTKAASKLSPQVVINELDAIFSGFDHIANIYRCERIKTIGDAYLFVCGLPEPDSNHCENVVRASLNIIDYLKKRNRRSKHKWLVRIGLHSGQVVGGIVGTDRFLYDIFGDTVNIAARMEEHSFPMRITVSAVSYKLLKKSFSFSQTRKMVIKGMGSATIYTLADSSCPDG
jgi:CheY-like chemotaxis protein